jgi:hypothetical protein
MRISRAWGDSRSMDRQTTQQIQMLEQGTTALVTTSDARGLSTRRVTRPDRAAVTAVQEKSPAPSRGLAAPRNGLGSFGSPSGLGRLPFGG